MNEWGVFLTLFGVWGWIASMVIFIFKGFPARGVIVGRQVAIWGCTVLSFFVCWIVGMLVA
jgi:hypothetical protein